MQNASTVPCTLSLHDALPISAVARIAPPHRIATDVEIVGLDYAFQAPADLPPGLTTFRFRNAGKHRHEFNRSEEHTSELQSHSDLVCRLLLEKKKERQPAD